MAFWGLAISSIISFILLIYIFKQKNKNQLQRVFLLDIALVFCWDIGILLQELLCSNFNINPYIFEYFVYIFACSLPVAIFFTGLIFANTKIKFKGKYILLFIIPIVSLVMVWTNNYHHLFYINYSLNLNENIMGPYYSIYSIYNLLLYIIGLTYLLRYSIKNSGFFSKQAVLFTIATLIPLVINGLGSLGIINMSVYITPILFTVSILLCTLAIFKYDFLKVTPIAMQRVVDRMSDSFLVVNENGIITDFNETFLKTFNLKSDSVRNINFIEFLHSKNVKAFNDKSISTILNKSKATEQTILVKREMPIGNKYFNIEASGILSQNVFLGTLILLKDVTQHMLDMQTIQNNQQLLMERERLASLGQLIGGIAHNLKTPIMSISGAAEGLTDLVKEYDSSIGDPEVTNDDHHDIAKDMREWIEKIKTYTAYMSDVITTVKGQAVTLSEEQVVSFDIDELVKRVDILMKHELKNALVVLNVQMNTSSSTTLHGNIVSLVQVINNMISNSIQAYNGVPNKEINFIVDRDGNNIILSIQDFAGGLPKEVEEKLFKEMITTKGKNGTGLGLFMSYSTIRAHFNGNITFETEQGKGTTFHIIIPVE